MKKLILSLSLLTILVSCNKKSAEESFVYFSENQPENVNSISEIPNDFIGQYVSGDSESISFEKNKIIRKWFSENKISIKQKDSISYLTFHKNYLIDNQSKQKVNYTIKNDSIYWNMSYSDTISTDNKVLKLYKNSLVVNTNIDGKFHVEVYKKENNQINNFSFSTENDFEQLKKAAKLDFNYNIIENDTNSVIINAKRADFRKILRKNASSYQVFYNKI